MFPRNRPGPFTALLLAASLSTWVAAAPAPQGGPTPGLAGPPAGPLAELFRVHLGSSISAPPSVDDDGTVYVGASDGVLAAIDVFGAIRWSFTLRGPIVAGPVVARGRVFAATTEGRLGSVWLTGRPAADHRTAGGVATDLVLSARYGMLFGGRDGALWAYSTRGTAAWHVKLGEVLAAPPASAGARIAVVTRGGEAIGLDGATPRFRLKLGAVPSFAPVVGRDGGMAVVAGGVLHVVDGKGKVRFRREDVRFVAQGAASTLLVIDAGGALLTLGGDGATLHRQVLGFAASAPPLLGPDGRTYVAGEGGEVAVIGTAGGLQVLRVAQAALRRPVVDAARGRLVLAAGTGELVVLGVR